MKLQLIWLYFKRQHRRTVFTAFILSLGLIIILTSYQLINGFENEIASNIWDRPRIDQFYIGNLESSTETSSINLDIDYNRLQSLENWLNSSTMINSWSSYYSNFQIITYTSQNMTLTTEIQIVVANPLNLQANAILPEEFQINENETLIGSTLDTILQSPDQIKIDSSELNDIIHSFYPQISHNSFMNFSMSTDGFIITQEGLTLNFPIPVSATPEFSTSLIISEKLFYYYLTQTLNNADEQKSESITFLPNRMLVTLADRGNFESVNSYLNNIGLQLIIKRGDREFISVGASQVVDNIVLLQLAMSVLIILSMVNIFIELFDELKPDFKILVQQGYDFDYIILFILGIATIIGVFAGTITILTSTLISNTIISLLAIIGNNPFIIISTNFEEIIEIMVQSILIANIAAIYPILKVKQFV
jgi:hypothetical protein